MIRLTMWMIHRRLRSATLVFTRAQNCVAAVRMSLWAMLWRQQRPQPRRLVKTKSISLRWPTDHTQLVKSQKRDRSMTRHLLMMVLLTYSCSQLASQSIWSSQASKCETLRMIRRSQRCHRQMRLLALVKSLDLFRSSARWRIRSMRNLACKAVPKRTEPQPSPHNKKIKTDVAKSLKTAPTPRVITHSLGMALVTPQRRPISYVSLYKRLLRRHVR